MPAKSQQQLKFIYALRNKYKSKKDAPKKMKWVFDDEWTEGVKMKELPKTKETKESYVLTFEKFNLLNEAVIDPIDYKEELEKIFDTRAGSLEEYNDRLKHLRVKFISREEWIDSLQDQTEKDNVPELRPTPFGFSYAGYNYYDDMIYLICGRNSLNTINNSISSGYKTQFINMMNDTIRHEQIHREQNKRRAGKGVTSNLKSNPEKDKKGYLSDKDEIMAHARTMADILISSRHTKEEILKLLRSGRVGHPLFYDYEHIGGDVFRRFLKYLYMYLDEQDKTEE
jgi:hypothetical protein